jgi:hypothetical protein
MKEDEYDIFTCMTPQCLQARIFGKFYGKHIVKTIKQEQPRKDEDGDLWLGSCETLERAEIDPCPTVIIRFLRWLFQRWRVC